MNHTLRWQRYAASSVRDRRDCAELLVTALRTGSRAVAETVAARILELDRFISQTTLLLTQHQVAAIDAERGTQNAQIISTAIYCHNPLMPLFPNSESNQLMIDQTGHALRSLHGPCIRTLNATLPADITDPRNRATTTAQLREIWTHLGMWLAAADHTIEQAADPTTAAEQVERWLTQQ